VRLDPDGRIQQLRDAEGRTLARARIEPAPIGGFLASDGRDRMLVHLHEVPDSLVDAILVTEDQRFFEHRGVDVRRIVASGFANLRTGRVMQGGSTITQQLVKNVYLVPERTLWRKLREMVIASILERHLSKEEILEAYLNEIYLDQDGSVAIHGVGLAARHYFGKDVGELGVPEAALLAGIIRAPSVYSPFRDPAAARTRRDFVLRQMREARKLTESEYRSAVEAPLGLRLYLAEVRSASYFVDFLHERLAARHGDDALERQSLSIFSGLDLRLQVVAEEVVRRQLERIERRFPHLSRERSPLQAALLVLEPRTGQILALVGGRDHRTSPFNRATAARRQPGSIFKPVVVLAALKRSDDGVPDFTLTSILRDEPFRLRGRRGRWQPQNHDRRFRGDVTLREALEQSLNVPLVRLAAAVGPGRVISTARRMGIESPLEPIPSLPLGTLEVSLLEITRAYAVLAAGGSRAPLGSTLGVVEADGAGVDIGQVKTLQVFSPGEAYLVTSALQGAADRGTSASLRELGYHGAIAGKTGTTDRFRDAWFVGYTPEIVVGVWVGFDNNRYLGRSGSELALPIAADFLIEVLGPTGAGHFRPPADVERARVRVEKDGRCRSVVELFLVGTAPADGCRGGPSSPGSAPRVRASERG
jgi:penicillin-binding protein 1B